MNSYQKILSIYLFFLIIYWVILQFLHTTDSIYNYLYSFSFSLIPLLGGLAATFLLAKYWGMFTSSLGKAISCIGLGLFSWGMGSMFWAYYNIFLHIPAPYPSFADFWYIVTVPLWAYGIINLSHATGAKYGLRHPKGKFILFSIPIIIFVISYYILVVVARGGVLTGETSANLKLVFDLAYPFADVIILSLAVLVFGLSINYFGGKYKNSIIVLLLGFGIMYLADFVFSYTTTINTFYVGDFGDLIFTFALFCITYGILGFSKPVSKE